MVSVAVAVAVALSGQSTAAPEATVHSSSGLKGQVRFEGIRTFVLRLDLLGCGLFCGERRGKPGLSPYTPQHSSHPQYLRIEVAKTTLQPKPVVRSYGTLTPYTPLSPGTCKA